jgi:spore maturation protein A
MLNKIWFWLFVIGVTVGVLRAGRDAVTLRHDDGTPVTAAQRAAAFGKAGQAITKAGFDSAKNAVTLCLNMIGGFALFLGLVRIAQDAGLVQSLANALKPVFRRLFPGIPDGHPAAGAITMNFAANFLGLDNAATPLGIKAMEELQTLNASKDTATNDMAMLMAINTGCICLVPTGILVLRAAYNSENPGAPVPCLLLTTFITTATAVLAARWLAPRFPVEPPKPSATEEPR